MSKQFLQNVFLIVGLIAVSGFLPLAHAQEATGTVSGHVRSINGPVFDTKVVITSGASSSYEASLATDQFGDYAVSGVPVGGEVSVLVFDQNDELIGEGSGILNVGGATVVVDVVIS